MLLKSAFYTFIFKSGVQSWSLRQNDKICQLFQKLPPEYQNEKRAGSCGPEKLVGPPNRLLERFFIFILEKISTKKLQNNTKCSLEQKDE